MHSAYYREYGIVQGDVYNMDETGFRISVSSSQQIITIEFNVTRAPVGEWGLSRTKVCSGAVGVLRVAISGSRQGIEKGRDLR